MKTASRIVLAVVLIASLGANAWQWRKLQRWEVWADGVEASTAQLVERARQMEERMEQEAADAARRSAEMMQLARQASHARQIGDAQSQLVIAQYEDRISQLESENKTLRSKK